MCIQGRCWGASLACRPSIAPKLRIYLKQDALVTMAPKAKNVVGSKQSRKGEAFGFGNREPVKKFRKKAVERYGGITRFIKARGIEEEVLDLTIPFHLDLTDEEMEKLADCYPLTESASSLCRTSPTFLEPLDDDEATADEVMDDEKDDVDDEEANALMMFDGGKLVRPRVVKKS
ncbi:hypothetical protein H5410_056144 [Solanum commersonii]|uniref:Uncharacterized protein n=1 Tax=Solanum commersonii TaxID=4109 RepID=A0A9J5WKE8_SOLCO|nr:hypothetical protein H5410_056144 [Solanum commersonii]